MIAILSIFICLLLPVTLLGEMTDDIKTLLIKLHNEHRANLGASNMFKMEWDSKLATKAEDWANRCVYDHSGRGENLAWNKPPEPMTTEELVTDAFDGWFAEKKDHVYGAKKCFPYSSCHYTQIAWHSTNKLGCAYKNCSSLTNAASNAWWIVCEYLQVGNTIGEKVFEQGAACSHSDCKGLPCEGGLCVGEVQIVCKDQDTNCKQWAENKQCETNPDFVKPKCPKSCKLCTSTDKDGGTDGGSQSDEAEEECKDINKNCKEWAKANQCYSNPSFMKPNCQKSCQYCKPKQTDTEKGSCVDSDAKCKGWSKKGECKKNPTFMLVKCKLSCKQC